MSDGFFPLSMLSESKAPPTLAPRCGSCGLYKTCQSPKMPVSGRGKRNILLLGEAPGKNEDDQNQAFVGEAGGVLDDALASVGVRMRHDCWITNSLICRPPRNRTPSEKEIEFCRPNLLRTLDELKPEVIIPLGATAIQSLIGWLWKEDTGAMSRWLGWNIPSRRLNSWICPTWHPSYVLRENHGNKTGRNPVLQLLFEQHLGKAASLSGRPYKVIPPDLKSKVKVILNDDEAAWEVNDFLDKPNPVAFDFETDRLKPDSEEASIVCCAVSNGSRTISYPWLGKAVETTQKLLESKVPKIGYNCFSGDTKFLCREYGMVNMASVVGRTLTVLNHKGEWTEGTVRCFGTQQTTEVVFSRRNFMVTVKCTQGHEWISAEDGRRIPTSKLCRHRYVRGKNIGPDRVPYLNAPKVILDSSAYRRGVQHGIVFGDGCKRKDREGFFQVRLCGEKSELMSYLSEYKHSYPQSYGGEPCVYVTRQAVELKELPPDDASDSYLIGFLRGLIATDGCVNHNHQISITNCVEAIEWCKRVLPKVGYSFQSEVDCGKYTGQYDGSYGHGEDSRTLYLSRECIAADDLLRSFHRKNYKDVRLGPFKFSKFGDSRVESVYCLVVPNGNSFTLDWGLVTGNCKFEERWWMQQFGCRVSNWVHDGMLAAHVLDNRKGISSLKFQSFVILGIDSYDDYVKPYLQARGGNTPNRIREADLNRTLLYCGCDALLEYEIAQIQMKELESGGT